MPMDETLLRLIPASYVGMFFASWIPTLLDIPKFATPMPIAGCEENCTSAFLPGGIETARKIAPFLNMTLMEGGIFRDAETIQIQNAPGILLRFDDLPLDFDFDRKTECHTYGQHLNDTLQVCIRSMDGRLAFGESTFMGMVPGRPILTCSRRLASLPIAAVHKPGLHQRDILAREAAEEENPDDSLQAVCHNSIQRP